MGKIRITKGGMDMPNAQANGIQIEYETFGSPSSPALMLIMGLGGQMIAWDEELCREMARGGHYVIRFDNRDVGLSSKMESAGLPDMRMIANALLKRERIANPPYTLDDMADDAVGLLDALGIRKAHICGMSMGGMIAQTIALKHPSRVLSLVSIYSGTGNPEMPQPKPEIFQLLLTPPPEDYERYIEHMVRTFRAISGPGFSFDEVWMRKLAAESYKRSCYPQGTLRQLVAIIAQGNWKAKLSSIKVPALVIHGTDDPLVPFENGKDTAEAIAGTELLPIEGMGHDLPHGGAWPRIVEAISAHTKKAIA